MLYRKSVDTLSPYVPGFQPAMDGSVIKINSNENPYPPSPKVKELLGGFDFRQLRYYPDATSQPLRELIGAQHGLSSRQVLCGNGSDEVISLIFKVFFEQGDTVATPYPTYTFYKSVADIINVKVAFVDTAEDFVIDLQGLVNTGAKGIFIANPNAQTGRLLPLQSIEELLNRYNGLVVIDEAYIDFAGQQSSAVHLIGAYPNLIVLRTLSKSYSLCGIRVGFCIADESLIHAMDKCRDSYNVNHLSQIIAAAALSDQPYLETTVERVVRSRDKLEDELHKLGFTVYPSHANFLLCKPHQRSAADIYNYLKAQQIYVRHFDSPRLSDKLRISIGTEEEVESLLRHLRQYLGSDAAAHT
ncbi:histidinol-phosphate transaminase [Paenibacillus oenotherae]|uniref:histidinol-phosphate transaminase n=1 Tax=Paenibacillus oenotherae TaxID=1435645 RepID=UPI001FE63C1F|nr:histidinol-phosphate transaminase [Paenibacillus oenotherae]